MSARERLEELDEFLARGLAVEKRELIALVAALRAVLDVHRRIDTNGGSWCVCVDGVTHGTTFDMWPCATVRAIESALGPS